MKSLENSKQFFKIRNFFFKFRICLENSKVKFESLEICLEIRKKKVHCLEKV